jgi:hypothetical protein
VYLNIHILIRSLNDKQKQKEAFFSRIKDAIGIRADQIQNVKRYDLLINRVAEIDNYILKIFTILANVRAK